VASYIASIPLLPTYSDSQASRTAIVISVVRFVETFHIHFLAGTSRISLPVTLDCSRSAEGDNKEKEDW